MNTRFKAEPSAPPAELLTEQTSALGRELRRLRLNKGLSIQAFAEKADVSAGLLSQIERGISSPSLRTLTKLRHALGVPLGALFEGSRSASAESRFVQRREGRRRLDLGSHRLVKEMLSPNTSSPMQVMILVIPPGGGSGDQPYNDEGEKAGLVLEGFLQLVIDGESFDLRQGDSFQFDSSLPHRFHNLYQDTARVLWIIRKAQADVGL